MAAERPVATMDPAPQNLGSRLGGLRADFIAGITVTAISLPQSMAYALIAGVDPRFGLYTAIVFGAIASLLGSSRHLINGPTGAVSLLVFSALAFVDPESPGQYFEAMFLLAVMTGMVQITVAVTRLGDITRYISESVVTGFIAGAAILTMVGQVANLLGVRAQGSGDLHVFYRLWLTITQEAPFNPRAMAVGAAAIVTSLLARRLIRRMGLPQVDMLVTVVVVSLAVKFLGWSDATELGADAVSLVEKVPAALPAFHVPRIDIDWISHLFSSAFAVGILGLLEALAIAKAIAQKSRQPLDYNRQCLAEGVGNLMGGFFQCMPGAGSLSRSAINYQAGAQSRWSGVISALAVGVAVLLAAPLASQIPKAVLAGLLMVAASRLIDPARLHYFLTASRYDATLTLVTGVSALAAGIEFSILLGSGLSIVWYVLKAARIHGQELVVDEALIVRARTAEDSAPKGVLIHDLEGDLFFGAAPDLEHYLDRVLADAQAQNIQHVVVRLKRTRNFDAVTLEVLEHFLKAARAQGVVVLLAGLKPELLAAIQRMAIARDTLNVRLYAQAAEEHSATLAAILEAYRLAAAAHASADRAGWPDVRRLAGSRYQV